jgi:hypothetical protein
MQEFDDVDLVVEEYARLLPDEGVEGVPPLD